MDSASIQALAVEEQGKKLQADELGKAPPLPTLKNGDFAGLKTFLMDMGGTNDVQGAYMAARKALDADDEDGFVLASLILFKTTRKAYLALEI